MSEPKYAHRFPPCPVYDIEGLESWLEDLARQGLILTRGGLFCGFAEFEKAAPKPMRYRLQPLPKKKFLDDRRPADAALELAEEYGWEYLCNMGDCAVYGCEDPNARELDTDPQVQAMAMQQVCRRKRNEVITLFASILICLGFLLRSHPVYDLIHETGWSLFRLIFVFVLAPIVCMHEFRQWKTMQQKLTMGEPLSRTKNWRKNRWRHWVIAVCTVCLYASVLIAPFVNRLTAWPHSKWQPIADYTGDIPFAVMEDLAGDGSFAPDGYFVEEDNHIAERSTLLAPRQVKLQQMGDVVLDGAVLLDGILEVEYYELQTDWLARQLFREIRQTDSLSKRYHTLELAELPTEQELAYVDVFPTLLLQNGTEVLRLEFTKFDGGADLTLDQWSAMMADSLIS